MLTFETPGGKVIKPYYDGHLVRLKFTTGGELPACLAGVYTSWIQAKTSVEKYIDTSAPKPKDKA